MFKCQYCGLNLQPSTVRHVQYCEKRNLNLSKEQIKEEFLRYNFPLIANKEILYREYSEEKKSLPTLKRKYGIGYNAVLFLLKYYNIPNRDSSEASNLAMPQRKQTNIKRYGADNPLGIGTEPYKKRNKTVLNKYGVSNIFAADEIKRKICSDEPYLKTYGETFHEFRSRRSREVWERKTDEQKNEWLLKSIWAAEPGRHSSKLESRICDILCDKNITFTSQFYLMGKYYDFCMPDIKMLLEINGDFWHANPQIYKETDEMKWPGGKLKCAGDLWAKDEEKRKIAVANKYKISYIWESEMKKINNLQLCELLVRRIDENCRN